MAGGGRQWLAVAGGGRQWLAAGWLALGWWWLQGTGAAPAGAGANVRVAMGALLLRIGNHRFAGLKLGLNFKLCTTPSALAIFSFLNARVRSSEQASVQ